MKTNLLKKLALILCLIGIANINGYSQDVKAQGRAYGIAMEKTIVYTLSVGSFNQTADEVANWELSGQDSQDLGDIVSVVISGEDRVATITVTNELETQMAYMIQPLQSAMSAGYEMPDPVTIDVLAKAVGTAEGIAGEKEIIFTLTTGTFNMAEDRGGNRFSEIISNWELDGQDSQDLGAIVSIVIDNEGKLATVTVTNELETRRAYSLRPLQEAMSIGFGRPDLISVDVSLSKATAIAVGNEGGMDVTYTLTTGSFSQTAGQVSNWELSGQDSQDLGDIVSVVISGEDRVATITVTNELETQMAYMIQPLQSAMSAGYEMPDPVTIDVLAKAVGTAEGIAGEKEIIFTLTTGTFNMAEDRGGNRFSEIISNWELDGQDAQDLGAIVSIVIDNERKLATVTVTNELETRRAYSLRPLQEAVSNNYVMPDPVPVSVSLATSVSDLKSQSVVVYPNPFDQNIFVEAGYWVQQIVVYNLSGQLVLDVLPSERNSIETESLPKGIYFVKVVGYDGVSQLFKMLKD